MSLHYEDAATEELVQRTNTHGAVGTVLVQFPFNDYRTAHGIKAHSPQRHLKLLTDKQGAYVRFNGLKWNITKVRALVMTREDGSTYRHLEVRSIEAR